MAYEIDSLPGLIELGNLNELGVSLIEFDVTDWLTDYPLGTFNITYIRPGETDVYPVDVTGVSEATPESGNLELDVTRTELGVLTEAILMWTVSDAVTATAGSGSIVVELAEGGTIKKRSDKVQSYTADGHAAAGDPPEPLADYIEKWSAVDIEVTGLETGANPTGAVSQGADGTHFELGIPKGDKGDKGDTGDSGIYIGDEEPTNPLKTVWLDTDEPDLMANYQEMMDATDAANTATGNANAATASAVTGHLWRQTSAANPVSVYPVPESPLYAKVSGTYTQSGTGDPSPSNIRPISPWLASGGSASVKRTGKNRIAYLENGYICNATNGEYRSVNANTTITNPILVDLTITNYVISGFSDAIPCTMFFYNGFPSASTFVGRTSSNTSKNNYTFNGATALGIQAKPTNTTKYIVLQYSTSDYAGLNALPLQMELGSVATPYEPYAGDEITLTAPQEIAAGWMDNEGHGQITHGYIASYVDETVPGGWVSSIGELSAGAQVVYPLATPIDITPTAAPLISIPQLDRITPRQNVLTASTGNVELTYAKSPIQEADEIAAAIALLV